MSHRARQVTKEDLLKFDYLLTMDTMNLEDMKELSQELNTLGSVKAGKSATFTTHSLIKSPIIW